MEQMNLFECGLVLICIAVMAGVFLFIAAFPPEDLPNGDFNGHLSLSSPQATACPVIPACPACPACSCSASCPRKVEVFEACHLPEGVFFRPSKTASYTGFSNIPSIFMGNELVTVKPAKNVFFPGCFYGFEDEGELKVHRLVGVYEDYLVFKGDNNRAVEKAERDSVRFLVREIRFT